MASKNPKRKIYKTFEELPYEAQEIAKMAKNEKFANSFAYNYLRRVIKDIGKNFQGFDLDNIQVLDNPEKIEEKILDHENTDKYDFVLGKRAYLIISDSPETSQIQKIGDGYNLYILRASNSSKIDDKGPVDLYNLGKGIGFLFASRVPIKASSEETLYDELMNKVIDKFHEILFGDYLCEQYSYSKQNATDAGVLKIEKRKLANKIQDALLDGSYAKIIDSVAESLAIKIYENAGRKYKEEILKGKKIIAYTKDFNRNYNVGNILDIENLLEETIERNRLNEYKKILNDENSYLQKRVSALVELGKYALE